MNVVSSQNVSSTSNTTSTQSKSSSTAKTSEKSFDEEMKTASKPEDEKQDVKKTEKETKTSQVKNDKTKEKDNDNISDELDNVGKNIDDDLVNLHNDINFTDFKYHNESQNILTQNIQSLLNTKDLMSAINSAELFDYDAINMSEGDANFFANLVKTGEVSFDSLSQDLINNNKNISENVKVSSVLMDKLSESMNTNKPFRINFDKDISVIIKVNKDGSLSAHFIPGDKAVEQYLKENISFLKQRFDDENLAYSELSYGNSNNRGQQRQKKENDNE